MFSLRFVFDFSSVDFGFSSVSIVDEGEFRIKNHVLKSRANSLVVVQNLATGETCVVILFCLRQQTV